MKINTDSLFRIGSGHSVCEDYALNFNDGVIVCDGCSSASNTDIGSRLLALTALQTVQEGWQIDESIFGVILLKLKDILHQLNLDVSVSYATLMMGVKKDNRIKILISGDGTIITEGINGDIEVRSFEFPNNLPRYLSYQLLATTSMYEYLCLEPEMKMITEYWNNDTFWKIEKLRENKIIYFDYPIQNYKNIILTSDGIDTFGLKRFDLAKKILDIKSTKGKFIQRRLNKILKELSKENITHFDDLSIGAVNIEHHS